MPTLKIKTFLVVIFIVNSLLVYGQKQWAYNAVYSGVPWFDDKGNTVSAHGANIVFDHGRYYLFGEAHTDTSNAFAGFNCYSSADLYTWQFETVALPVQAAGKMGPNRVGERVKVMRCPKTGEYIMFMHSDTLGYTDPIIAYASSATIAGPYVFRGPLLYNDNLIKKWDMGTFQDRDGSGYLLIHGGNIFKLSDDYKSATQQVAKNISPECESPAVFRKGNVYYWLASHRTSWERNDNFYYTSDSLKGPWTYRGTFAPAGTFTWDSQTTFVLPIASTKDTTFMFMGDRWSFPRQASSATYVWQPLNVSGITLSIPQYKESWQINTSTGAVSVPKIIGKKTIENTDKQYVSYSGKWEHNNDSLSISSSNDVGASFSVKFTGTQIALYCLSRRSNGYARITLRNSKGVTILSSIIDTYSKYSVSSPRFLTPMQPRDNYVLTVEVLAERPNWTDKTKTLYGSTGNSVCFEKAVITK